MTMTSNRGWVWRAREARQARRRALRFQFTTTTVMPGGPPGTEGSGKPAGSRLAGGRAATQLLLYHSTAGGPY